MCASASSGHDSHAEHNSHGDMCLSAYLHTHTHTHTHRLLCVSALSSVSYFICALIELTGESLPSLQLEFVMLYFSAIIELAVENDC